jgi:hypothetical protein
MLFDFIHRLLYYQGLFSLVNFKAETVHGKENQQVQTLVDSTHKLLYVEGCLQWGFFCETVHDKGTWQVHTVIDFIHRHLIIKLVYCNEFYRWNCLWQRHTTGSNLKWFFPVTSILLSLIYIGDFLVKLLIAKTFNRFKCQKISPIHCYHGQTFVNWMKPGLTSQL